MNGSGVTATGLNLTAGEPAYEIAVDPSVIPLGELRARHPQPVRHPPRVLRRRHRRRDHRPPRRHLRLARPRRPGRLGRTPRHRHPRAEPRHRQPPRRDHPDRASQPAATPASSRVRDARRRGPLPLTPGQQAKILPSGLAAAPQRRAAGREARDRRRQPAHLKALHLRRRARRPAHPARLRLRLLGRDQLHPPRRRRVRAATPRTPRELESYGQPGPGAWITVYANSGHAFIAVAGIVMNTAWYAPVNPTSPDSGPRWQPASTIPAQYAGDQYGGFVQRHPARTLTMRRQLTASVAALAARRGCARRLRDLRPLHRQAAAPRPSTSTPDQRPSPTPTRHPSAAARSRRPRAPRRTRVAAGAAQPTPQAALERYARLYVNWTADRVAGVQRELASLSHGPGARPGAAGRRQLHARPDTRPKQRREQRPPRRHHAERHDARAVGPRDLRADDAAPATTRASRRRCTSSTRKSRGPRRAGS